MNVAGKQRAFQQKDDAAARQLFRLKNGQYDLAFDGERNAHAAADAGSIGQEKCEAVFRPAVRPKITVQL
jgi:hypothetical protein